jgi:alpha-glucosidase
MSIAEIHEFDWRVWASYYGANLDELHMPFNFGLLATPWAGRAVRDHVEAIERVVPVGAWPNYVLGNHDESRLASRVGTDQARAALLLLLTLRGTPTLYYGDELGMTDVPIPPVAARDPWGRLTPGFGRDPSRTPMPWSGAVNAGFCAATARPWLPLGDDHATRNVEVQRADPRSTLALVRALLLLRRAEPALQRGSYSSLDAADDCLVFARDELRIAINFAGEPRTVAVAAAGARGTLLLSTAMDREQEAIALSRLTLRPHEGCIVRAASP